MKRTQIWRAALALVLLALCLPARAEVYPIYEVAVRPALLRETPEIAFGANNIIYTAPYESPVLVAGEENGWCLVYTQDGLCGYLMKNDLRPTSKTHDPGFAVTRDLIAGNNPAALAFITVDPKAVLPGEAVTQRDYPATLMRGEADYTRDALLLTLLGEDYVQKPRSEYAQSDDYISASADKLHRYAYVYEDTGEFSYYDSMVTGERGGEYEPPAMNMTTDESLLLARALLKGIVPDGWLAAPGKTRGIQARWSYEDRWLTDAEYDRQVRSADAHWFVFEHTTQDGVAILEDDLLATVGVNGLAGMRITRHQFAEKGDARAALMPLSEAIQMAGSTRMSRAVLLYARPVYSNWVTQNEEYNLSWYLLTSQGSYVVDCVRGAHKCDSYEY